MTEHLRRPGALHNVGTYQRRSAAGVRILLAIAMCIGAPLTASALTKTITVPFNYGWPGSAWGCGDALPILHSGTFSGTFSGGLPVGSKVTNVTIVMPMRRAGIFYAGGDADPVVTVSIGGQSIATPNVVAGYFACPTLSDLNLYVFDQPFANGFAAYVPNGSNAFTIEVQGGTCPHWCGVTARNDQVMSIEVTYDPPPPAEFAITSQADEKDRRILLSNVRPGYAYPYFQAIGGKDAEVTTYLRARDSNGVFKSGLTVYMRIVDPPDSAPYMNQPGNVLAFNDDNYGIPAVLDGPSITVHSPGVYKATSGANGRVDFTLRLESPSAAGDNYQIEASLDPGFPKSGSARSGILTAWKRVFIEKRRMLRSGLFLAQDANAGDTFIVTRGHKWPGDEGQLDYLSKGEMIVITHAPQLDRSDLGAGWYDETRTILSVKDLGNGEYRVNFGTKQGKNVTVEQLQHGYKVDKTDTNIGDGISKVDALTLGPNEYFDAETNLVTGEAFLGAYIDNIYLPDATTPGAMALVPFIETEDQPLLQNLVEKWSTVVGSTLLPNHQLLVVASDNKAEGEGDLAGLTITRAQPSLGRTSSYVFRASIAQQLGGKDAGLNEAKWAMKTSAHEIAHQWRTNAIWPVSGPSDHCPNTSKAYNDAGVYCLLAYADSSGSASVAQRTNGIARFHLLKDPNGHWHSEYLGIRRRPDPFVP